MRYLLFSLFIFFAVSSFAQPKVFSHVEKTDWLLGDKAALEYHAVIPRGYHYRSASIKLPEDVSEIAPRDSSEQKIPEGLQKNIRVYISFYDSGRVVIPGQQFYFTGSNGNIIGVKSDSIVLHFNRMTVDTTKDIKPIKEANPPKHVSSKTWMYVFGALALLFIAVVILFLSRKKPEEDVSEKHFETAHEKALRRIRQLEESDFGAPGKLKAQYSELADILRQFISEVFDVDAMEQTTPQTLTSITRKVPSKKAISDLQKVLELADLVKFAKYIPVGDENEVALVYSKNFIHQARHEEGIPTAGPGKDFSPGD